MNTKENQNRWIEKVHENLTLRGRSENTYINYKCALNHFFNYYEASTNIESLSEEEIIPYLIEYYIKLNKSKNSYNLTIAAIRLFYIVCFNKTLNKQLLPSSKIPKRLPTILPKDKFIRIFNEEKSLKHKCWLILAFCCGLRVSEIAELKVENLNSKEHKLRVEKGKGNKERYTILPDIVIKILRLYCLKNQIKEGYLFPGSKDKSNMSGKTIINYFSTIKSTYKLDSRISFHSLRHSFATYYLMNGGSLLTLQSMLGHNNLNTTAIYIHLSQNFNELEGIKYV